MSEGAVPVAATIAAALFHVLASLHQGYLDPFFPIACFVSWVLAVAIAGVVGIPFYLMRRTATTGHCQK